MRLFLFLLFIAVAMVHASAPEGIPRELARERASAISDVAYNLHFTLVSHAPSVTGHEEMTFRLKSPASLLLDFREGTLSALTVNGKPTPATLDNGHVALPQDLLKAGPNTRIIAFHAPVAPP